MWGGLGHALVTGSPTHSPQAANMTQFWALTLNLWEIFLQVLRNVKAPWLCTHGHVWCA